MQSDRPKSFETEEKYQKKLYEIYSFIDTCPISQLSIVILIKKLSELGQLARVIAAARHKVEYGGVAMYSKPPTMKEISIMQMNETHYLIATKNNNDITIHWIKDAVLVEKTLNEVDVKSVIDKLPEMGQVSNDTELINEIKLKYGCTSPEHLVTADDTLEIMADNSEVSIKSFDAKKISEKLNELIEFGYLIDRQEINLISERRLLPREKTIDFMGAQGELLSEIQRNMQNILRDEFASTLPNDGTKAKLKNIFEKEMVRIHPNFFRKQTIEDYEQIKPLEGNGPYVLSLVMLGTQQHQSKDQNILTEWINEINKVNKIIGDDTLVTHNTNRFTHIINGIGGESRDNTPMLGTYEFNSFFIDNKLSHNKTPNESMFNPMASYANIKGSGYEEAIEEALNIVRTLIKNNKVPLTLNMAGFSRGADTILRISNAIYAEFGNKIEINIFAIDPVPGPFRQDSRKARIIPPNVKTYESVLMRDDQRLPFAPQDKKQLVNQNMQTTKTTFHLYHGLHGTGTKFDGDPFDPHDKKQPILDTARLVWDDLEKFSVEHGSLPKGNTINYIQKAKSGKKRTFTSTSHQSLTDMERLNCFSRMYLNKDKYNKLGGIDHIHSRDFTSRTADYFLYGNDYFIDKQHMELFKAQFPHIFREYFMSDQKQPDVIAMKAELNELKKYPDIERSIQKYLTMEQLKKSKLRGPIPEISDELINKWESIQRILNEVFVGWDNSLSISSANYIYNDIKSILFDREIDNDKKLFLINNYIQNLIISNKDNPLLVYKFNKMISPEINIEPLKMYIVNVLQDYLDQTVLLDARTIKDLSKIKHGIANAVIKQINLAKDEASLLNILDTALRTSAEARMKFNKKEGRLDDLIRNLILAISVDSKYDLEENIAISKITKPPRLPQRAFRESKSGELEEKVISHGTEPPELPRRTRQKVPTKSIPMPSNDQIKISGMINKAKKIALNDSQTDVDLKAVISHLKDIQKKCKNHIPLDDQDHLDLNKLENLIMHAERSHSDKHAQFKPK